MYAIRYSARVGRFDSSYRISGVRSYPCLLFSSLFVYSFAMAMKLFKVYWRVGTYDINHCARHDINTYRYRIRCIMRHRTLTTPHVSHPRGGLTSIVEEPSFL